MNKYLKERLRFCRISFEKDRLTSYSTCCFLSQILHTYGTKVRTNTFTICSTWFHKHTLDRLWIFIKIFENNDRVSIGDVFIDVAFFLKCRSMKMKKKIKNSIEIEFLLYSINCNGFGNFNNECCCC